ncbi:hypothetical protein ANN_16032 [Periplaneta americana]|uniref:Uncharacterized protein n=1 Tax=Periplaneta americana TaxID=6978 RepID=A0ABQ8SHY4_PERAM|nr:hypothetical protein ANN_16032 [Periplaneta americana]
MKVRRCKVWTVVWVIAALMMPLTLGGVAAVTGRPERASSADFFEELAPPGDVAMVQTIKRHTPPIFPLEEKLRREQLKWFGHMVRMREERKPKQVMEAMTEGRKGRRRPRTIYMDNIEMMARKREKGVEELRRMARDREEWRRWIEKDPTP